MRTPSEEKNPYLLVDHKLGIEAWAVKILFQHVYKLVMCQRNKPTDKGESVRKLKSKLNIILVTHRGMVQKFVWIYNL